MNEKIMQNIHRMAAYLRKYHQHKVVGMQNIPDKGPILLVVNHSLATYDISMLFSAIHEAKGRLPRPLADRWFFRFQPIAEFTKLTGAVEGRPEMAKSLLAQEELVAVAPGGMREALRPSSEKYQLVWEKRMGFVKLAVETQTPVCLAMCPKADDLYDVYENQATKWAYQSFKFPLPMIRGLGPTLLPRPIPLTHYISKPIVPPVCTTDKAANKKLIKAFHKTLLHKAEDLMGQALTHRDF